MGDSEAIANIRGHARHVGRVGALAFALGVGGAVLTGTAVASAETPESSPPSVSTSASSESETTDPGPTVSDDETATEDEAEEAAEAAEETEETEESETADESAQVEESDQDTAADDDASRDRDTSSDSTQAVAAGPEEVEGAAEIEEAEEPSFFEKLFANKTPTLDHRPAENTLVAGSVLGDLHPDDPDSTRLTYTATTPGHGSVVIDTDGTFLYTPGESYSGQDSFQVTVSDARSGFHIHGAAGLLNLFTFGLLGSSGHRSTQTVFIGYERATVVSGLNSPVDFRFLPDGRILVAEKAGAIRVVEDGVLREDPLITLAVRTESERGIEGLAVDPAFGTNGRIYVAYIDAETTRNTLSRFIVNGNTATFDTDLLVSTLAAAPNHHGGALGFGPDGALYWGVGDNATGANAQNLGNIHGKILRLNTDGSVPVDNPVINGARTHIYAYGLRNPFRLTFTPTGQLLVADVGAASFEEVNLVTAGGNYGWPSSEGLCTSACSGKTDPVFTYPRGSGAAITSVAVYQGKVFIADLVQGWIKVLTCTPDYTACGDVQTFDPAAGTTVVLAAGPDGNLYQLTYAPGELIAIKPAGGDADSEV
ncbi:MULTISPECIES: PQQ-dependent sugar dehydrogenase [Mycolicibacterium]|jgi:glucose/arabinose dehydrogenase|uniref:PQQ-dependent sugar dehydrogenase n=1 Tax=Mycolicibacterium TaxID=1866885 RepID=UPI001CA32FA9|nr:MULTISPECIES: PQQ-dependent sugar dehydrogenase [Mycolicibacterium]QZT57818.1 PQQ-dependent sugar dehydrogenase [Mycolicibacterium austroafricanum]